jgi:polysaccharide transporter, PST family
VNALGHWRAAIASAALTGSRVVSALAVNKIVATYLGPGGLAIVGQFQNFTAVVFGVTSGNISNAVITTIARADGELGRQQAISSAVASMAIGTGLVAVLIAALATPIAARALMDASLAPVLHWLAWLMVPLVTNVVLLAVIAATGNRLAFVSLNMAIALASVPVCWYLVDARGLEGAMISAVVVNGAAAVFTMTWLAIRRPFPLKWIFAGLHAASTWRLLRLAAMTLSTIIAIPAAQYLLRQRVIDVAGLAEAGQWQAALKTGEVLVMGASIVVSLYLLPRFAASSEASAGVALRAAGGLMLALAAVGALIVGGGGVLLSLLFSRDFSVASRLLPLQVLGDVLRSGAMVLQAVFMARSSTASYVAVDLAYAGTLVVAGYWLVVSQGSPGAAIAVSLAGAFSLSAAFILLRRAGEA